MKGEEQMAPAHGGRGFSQFLNGSVSASAHTGGDGCWVSDAKAGWAVRNLRENAVEHTEGD